MATYAIFSATLQSMVNDTTTALPAYDLQGGVTGELSYGEYARLRVQFDKTSGGNFAVGQRFVFNPVFFCDTPYVTPLQLGIGWVIDIANYTGSGVFDVYLRANNNLAITTHRNAKLVATRISNTRLQIDFYFYATQDLFAYISDVPRNNALTLLSASAGVPNLDNGADSAYRRNVSYIEFLMYAGDNNFLPLGTGDPYVRNPTTPTLKQVAYDIGARFMDNGIGAGSAWVGGALTENSLLVFSNDIGAYKFTDFTRKGEPYLSNILDSNFDILSFDGNEAILGKDAENLITLTLQRKAGFTPSKIVARLWRVDSLISAQPFVSEYNIQTADLPAADATAYPNPIGGSAVFSTPSSWSASPTQISVSFRINGTTLVSDAQYRVWIGIYDNAGGKSSSHLSRPMRVATDGRVRVAPLAITGNIQTFDYQYVGSNDVSLSLLQRFRAQIAFNSATFTGGTAAFLAALRTVSMQFIDTSNNAVVASGSYDFVAGASVTDPEITLQVAGANYVFTVELRVPFSGVPFPSNMEVSWAATFQTLNANGSTNTVTVPAVQIIRRKPIDIVEIDSISLLDYDEYLIGNFVYIDTLCRDKRRVVVEVRIDNNPPNKSVTALLIYSNQDGTLDVLEENGFTPINLPKQECDELLSVSPDFGVVTSAFFVLDYSLLPSRAQNIAVGVVLQTI